MIEQDQQVTGGVPTDEQLELVKWAKDASFRMLGAFHESLRQMVTMTTALLAGYAALLGRLPVHPFFSGLAALLLLSSLASSLLGSFPLSRKIDILCPEEIAAARELGICFKSGCLKFAYFTLLLAFAFVVLGSMIGGSLPTTPPTP